ncbi:hypothetical protein SBOR_3502 [Sclerotinia borealis F-4128]|uniref:Uncharacterized protein n=1 Tax=Sclerotinia borealis (strain F-4128) TaxID=1432307 RepID=W9CJC5_SCLBF|nr:hypothetical protein SBOR_3502 [Sclerotinia borealis F-4128]
MSQSTETTSNSFVMSPRIAESHSSNISGERSTISAREQAAIERWTFNRARTDKEHALFREKMQFQSADFHQFLLDTAKSSPAIAVPSPAWENIPFPVPMRTPIITEEPDNQHVAMHASFDEIQEVPRRRATPMDFGNQLQQPTKVLEVPSFTFDRASFDGGLGGLEIHHVAQSEHGAQPTDRDTMIKVGAVFEILPCSEVTQAATPVYEQNSSTAAPRKTKNGKLRILVANKASKAKHAAEKMGGVWSHVGSFSRASNAATGPLFVRSETEMATLASSTGRKQEDNLESQVNQETLDQNRKEARNCVLMPFNWIVRQFANLL